MKLSTVEVGVFVKPSGAQLRSASDESSLLRIWQEVGECLGYPKPDGWRFQIHKLGEVVKLYSRTSKDWAAEYPSIVQLIRNQVKDDQVILDTELVGFDQYGYHLEPSKLRQASHFRCYVLDALYLRGKDLTSWPTQARVPFIRENLQTTFQSTFTLAEYTYISSLEDLTGLYQGYRARSKEGFDGAIIKQLHTPYFTDVLKLKPEDTIDAVIVGACQNKRGGVVSLLLAVPYLGYKRWVPITKVSRKSTDWQAVWSACQPHILDYRPSNFDDPPDLPDIWIAPKIVVAIKVRGLKRSETYQVYADAAKECVLREDKGPDEATSFEQVLQMAGMTEKPRKLQPSLFGGYVSDAEESSFDEHEGPEDAISIEQILPTEGLIQSGDLVNESPIQLSLFEQ